MSAYAAVSPGKKRSNWRKFASFYATQIGYLLSTQSRVTRPTLCLRTSHRSPRRQAKIAQLRCHTHPATHDVVTSIRVRALGRVIGAPPISAKPPSRQYTFGSSILLQARFTAPYRISTRWTRRTWLATSTGTLVRCLTQSRRLCLRLNETHTATISTHAVFKVLTPVLSGNAEWTAIIWLTCFIQSTSRLLDRYKSRIIISSFLHANRNVVHTSSEPFCLLKPKHNNCMLLKGLTVRLLMAP